MNKYFYLLVLLLITNLSFGQKLERDEVDEFTNSRVQETSWVIFSKKLPLYTHIRLRKVNDSYLFDVKFLGGSKVFSVDKGLVLYLKFDDDEIIKIENSKYTIASYGAGAIGLIGSQSLGVYLKCIIDKEKLTKLQQKTVVKMRVYTSNGYREVDVKRKYAERFKKLMSLIE